MWSVGTFFHHILHTNNKNIKHTVYIEKRSNTPYGYLFRYIRKHSLYLVMYNC